MNKYKILFSLKIKLASNILALKAKPNQSGMNIISKNKSNDFTSIEDRGKKE